MQGPRLSAMGLKWRPAPIKQIVSFAAQHAAGLGGTDFMARIYYPDVFCAADPTKPLRMIQTLGAGGGADPLAPEQFVALLRRSFDISERIVRAAKLDGGEKSALE